MEHVTVTDQTRVPRGRLGFALRAPLKGVLFSPVARGEVVVVGKLPQVASVSFRWPQRK